MRDTTEGGWRLTGQKVWTTMAHLAQGGICLARTDPVAPKHEGITCFLVDMTSPGVDVRPLRELTGAELFNEVFLDDVLVPDDCVVGPVNGGWEAARTTLANERVSMGSGSSFGPGLESVVRLAGQRLAAGDTGSAAADEEAAAAVGGVGDVATSDRGDVAVEGAGVAAARGEPSTTEVAVGGADLLAASPGAVRDQLGALVAEGQAVAVLGLRATLRALAGAEPGAEASVRKVLGVEHEQHVQEAGLALLGSAAAATDGEAALWVSGFLGNRALSIAGGTSDIQRNVIAERLLDLPKDP
ncbi:MAG: acyl-CoA dehydrogenase family protein [Acidimicrobiales bacterium]